MIGADALLLKTAPATYSSWSHSKPAISATEEDATGSLGLVLVGTLEQLGWPVGEGAAVGVGACGGRRRRGVVDVGVEIQQKAADLRCASPPVVVAELPVVVVERLALVLAGHRLRRRTLGARIDVGFPLQREVVAHAVDRVYETYLADRRAVEVGKAKLAIAEPPCPVSEVVRDRDPSNRRCRLGVTTRR